MNLRAIYNILMLLTLWLAGCQVEGGTVQTSDTIKKLMPPSPLDRTRQTFNLNNADDRREGIQALSKHSWGLEGKYLEAYALLAKDDDALVRAAAVNALGRSGNVEYVPVLIEALDDPSEIVRMDAADALNLTPAPAAMEPLLLHAAKDENLDVRVRCIRALRHYRDAAVLDGLLSLLNDADFGIRYAAAQTLRELTGEDQGYSRARWQRRLAEKGDPFARPGQ